MASSVAGTSAPAPPSWQLHEQVKAGQITMHDFLAAGRAGHSRSAGSCNTMGTASTMACMAESLGVSLPHNAAIPAVDARRYALAHLSGMRIVEMVWEDLRLSKVLTKPCLRERHPRQRRHRRLDQRRHPLQGHRRPHRRGPGAGRLEPHGQARPTLVDLKPSGRFPMEEFYYARRPARWIRRLGDAGLLPHPDALTVNGKSLWENCRGTRRSTATRSSARWTSR